MGEPLPNEGDDEDDDEIATRAAAPAGGAGTVRVEATRETAGVRLDVFLARALEDLSRARLKALIEGGHVRVGGAEVGEPARRVNAGEVVTVRVPPPVPAAPRPEPIPLAIAFEDEDVVVVDKPAGLVVHPGAGHASGTLVNALLHHCGASLSGIGGVERPGIVHRLDRETSGLMVVAKNDRAHRALSAQFADHGREGPLERTYIAVVWGVPDPTAGTVEAPIGRHPRDRQRFAVVRAGGRHAVTHFSVAERFPAADPVASLLECRLETGRTHQIRVHLAHVGHPLLGDPLYGAGFRTKANRLPETARAALSRLGRQALHAGVLGFAHPRTREAMRFTSGPPAALAELIGALRDMA